MLASPHCTGLGSVQVNAARLACADRLSKRFGLCGRFSERASRSSQDYSMQNRDLPNIHTQFSQIANGDLMLTITMGFESSTDFTAAKQSSAILDRKLLDKAIARAFD